MNLLRRMGVLFRKESFDREMAEELRAHMELRIQKNLAAGMSPEEARYAAMCAFGGAEQIKERCRDERVRGIVWLEQGAQDVRYAMRTFARCPGFTSVILVSLALGIGANTAIFSLLDAVLWRMLPVAEPERLVFLERPPRDDSPVARKFCGISYPLMEALERREPRLEGATTFAMGGALARTEGEARLISVLSVAEDFYSLVGVHAAAGRLIQSGDVQAENVAVLSHNYWQRTFGGRPVLGESIGLNGVPHTIVGVAAREFFGLSPGEGFDVSVPLRPRDLLPEVATPTDPLAQPLFWVVGRLKPGVSAPQAEQSLSALLRQMIREDKPGSVAETELTRHRIAVAPASHGLNTLRAKFSRPLSVLMVLVTIVLLVTCANVANLLLARATAREREFAIRASLGAGRGRLWRQLLAESLLLALGGAALGILVSQWTAAAMVRFAGSGGRPLVLDVSFDPRALGFTLVVALGVGLLFGLAPAWRGADARKRTLHGRAKPDGSGLSWASRGLVAGHVALSLVLLSGAGLFVRSLQNLTRLDGGIRREDMLVVVTEPRAAGLEGAAEVDFYQQLLARLATVPGVAGVTVQRNLPLSGARSWRPFAPPGYQPRDGSSIIATPTEEVGPNYFQVSGLELVAGRDFLPSDDRRAPKVVVINEAAAREFFPGQNALGRRIGRRTQDRTEYEIVGIARDARQVSLREAGGPIVYMAALQDTAMRGSNLLIRTRVASLTLVPQIRQLVRETHPAVPVIRFTTLDEVTERALVQERMLAMLASAFGGLALLLAGVGLGGVLLFAVARRTREIGIRMALGATRATVINMLLRESLLLVAVGLAIGLPAAVALGRAAQGLLFGLSPTDPASLLVAMALLIAVALIAVMWPARRAAAVEPMVALRAE